MIDPQDKSKYTRGEQYLRHPELAVCRKDPNNLRDQWWMFAYFEKSHSLMVEEYRVETRPTTRHKFRSEVEWNRSGSYRGELKANDIPVPHDVLLEVMSRWIRTLAVGISERPNDIRREARQGLIHVDNLLCIQLRPGPTHLCRACRHHPRRHCCPSLSHRATS